MECTLAQLAMQLAIPVTALSYQSLLQVTIFCTFVDKKKKHYALFQKYTCTNFIPEGSVYCNHTKIGPPSKISTPLLLFERSCCKGCFSLESTPTYLCCNTRGYVKQEALNMQRFASGGTNK